MHFIGYVGCSTQEGPSGLVPEEARTRWCDDVPSGFPVKNTKIRRFKPGEIYLYAIRFFSPEFFFSSFVGLRVIIVCVLNRQKQRKKLLSKITWPHHQHYHAGSARYRNCLVPALLHYYDHYFWSLLFYSYFYLFLLLLICSCGGHLETRDFTHFPVCAQNPISRINLFIYSCMFVCTFMSRPRRQGVKTHECPSRVVPPHFVHNCSF